MARLQYEEYTVEDAQRDKAESDAARGGSVIKIKQGKNVFRVVPAQPGKKWKRVTYKHFVDVPGGSTTAFTCPKFETKGKRKCKTCAEVKKLLDTGDPLDEKKAKRMQAQRKVLCNVIDRKDPDSGPRVLEFGQGIERDLTEIREVDDIDFVNPIGGFDIIIIRTGDKRNNTRYKVKVDPKGACKLHTSKAVMADWIDSQHDLERFVHLESDEDIEARLRGEDPRESRGDRGNDRRPSRRARDEDDEKPAKRKPRGFDVAEDGVDADEDDEDEDEEVLDLD